MSVGLDNLNIVFIMTLGVLILGGVNYEGYQDDS